MNTIKPTTKWLMLGISYLVLIACFIPYIGWTPNLIEISDDLSLNYTQAGLLGSITALIGGLILPFAGLIGDKWGTKNIILLGLIAAIAGQLLFAWAPTYSLLIVGRALSGLGVGLLFVGPYTMAVNWFEREQKNGIALGVMFTTDGIGTGFALYIFSIVMVALGWRTGSVVGAVILVAVFVITVFVLKDAPAKDTETTRTPNGSGNQAGLRKALTQRNVLTAAAFFVGEWGIFAVVASWMPTILIENAGWSTSMAGLFSSLYVVVGMVTSICFGLISDRLGKRKNLIVVAGAAMTIFMTVLTIALASGNFVIVAICLPLVGLGVYTGMPLALALATESVPPTMAGSVNGFVLGVGFIVGGFAYPYFMGFIKDSTGGYVIGFISMCVATFVLTFLCQLASKDARGEHPAVSA